MNKKCPNHKGRGRAAIRTCLACALLNGISEAEFQQHKEEATQKVQNKPAIQYVSKKCSKHQGRGRAPMSCLDCARISRQSPTLVQATPRNQVTSTRAKPQILSGTNQAEQAGQAEPEKRKRGRPKLPDTAERRQKLQSAKDEYARAGVMRSLKTLGATDQCTQCPHHRQDHILNPKDPDHSVLCTKCTDERIRTHEFRSFLTEAAEWFRDNPSQALPDDFLYPSDGQSPAYA